MGPSGKARRAILFSLLLVGFAAGWGPSPLAFADAEIAPVPDVVGKAAADAKAAVSGAGFLPALFEVAGTPAGTVARQSPAAGAAHAVGSPVILEVRRAEATPTKAPNAVGLTPGEASSAFGSLYVLELVPRTGPGAPAGPVGKVVDQTPKMGASIDLRGTLVLGFVPDPSLAPRVAVPDATGLSAAEAIQAMATAGLHARVAQAVVPGAPADLVVGQSPLPGTEADRYSTVDVIATVAAAESPSPPGGALVAVPSAIGMTESSARATLSDAGLAAAVEWVDGEAASAFLVQSQDPAEGTTVAPGTTVRLRIVKYAPPEVPPPTPGTSKVGVPSLIGMTGSQAEEVLASLNLLANPIVESNPSVPALRVFAQQITPGTWVDPGTWISYRVSAPAPPTFPVPVPNFYGKSRATAVLLAWLAGLPLDVLYVSDPTKPPHRVFSQSVAAYTVVPVGTHVTVWISTHPGGPALVAVPNLKGKTKGQATTALAAAGLSGVAHEVLSPSNPPLRVFAQAPAAGAMAPAGSTVVFEVARLGPFSRTVPNLIGKTQAEAVAALAALSFGASVTEEFAPGKPVGRVFSQVPSAGSLRLVGTIVALKVAKLPAGMKPVPNVLGQTKADAIALLAANGFAADPDDVFAPGKPLGRVFDQTPAGGSSAPAGSTVHFKVAKGFVVFATVPNLFGKTQADAEAALAAAGLAAHVDLVFSPGKPIGRVFSQDPPAGAHVVPGTTVRMSVARLFGLVRSVPSLVGLTKAQAIAAVEAVGLVADPSDKVCLTCPVGRVMDQTPVAGTLVSSGSVVSFHVAKGLVLPVYKTVPNVVGMTKEAAKAAIEARGLVSDGEIDFKWGEPLHRVWKQSPAAGTLVPVGSTVKWRANP